MDVLDRLPRLDLFPVTPPANGSPLDPAATPSAPGDFAQALSLVPTETPSPPAVATVTLPTIDPQPVPPPEIATTPLFDQTIALAAYLQHLVPALPTATDSTAPVVDVNPANSTVRSDETPSPLNVTISPAVAKHRSIPFGLSQGLTVDPSLREALTTKLVTPTDSSYVPATTSFIINTFTPPVLLSPADVLPRTTAVDSTPAVKTDDDDSLPPSAVPSFITLTIPSSLVVAPVVTPPVAPQPQPQAQPIPEGRGGLPSEVIRATTDIPMAPSIAADERLPVTPATQTVVATFNAVPSSITNPQLKQDVSSALSSVVSVEPTVDEAFPQPAFSTAAVSVAPTPSVSISPTTGRVNPRTNDPRPSNRSPSEPARFPTTDSETKQPSSTTAPLTSELEAVVPTPVAGLSPIVSVAPAQPVAVVTPKPVTPKRQNANLPATDSDDSSVANSIILSSAVLPPVAPAVTITKAVPVVTAKVEMAKTVPTAAPPITDPIAPSVAATPKLTRTDLTDSNDSSAADETTKSQTTVSPIVSKSVSETSTTSKSDIATVAVRPQPEVATKESAKTQDDSPTDMVTQPLVRPKEPIAPSPPALDFGDPVPIHETRQVVQRLGDAIGLAHESGQHLSIRVTPPQFGPIVVNVHMHEGMVSARVETHSALAQQMLTDHLPALRESLSVRGAIIDRIDVIPIENRTSDRPVRMEATSTEASANDWLSSETPGQSGYDPQDSPPRRPPPRPIPIKPVREPAAVEPASGSRPIQLQELNVRV